MNTKKKPTRMLNTFSVLCIILCSLSILSCRVELFAKAQPSSTVVNPSESIQQAINNASSGDTILVLAGTYPESLSVNKSISLIGENRDQTIIDGQNTQTIINITVDNVDIEGFTIQSALNPAYGISISSSKGNIIKNNIMEDSQQGIALTSSSNNTISDNTITANTQSGIAVYVSNDNTFSGNTISGNTGGFSLYLSGGNVFSGNTLANNYPGDVISFNSYFNAFYDNNFNDIIQVDSGLNNTWDNGAEGNHWSNYAGHDRGDGIGLEPYYVVAGDLLNIDHHPLMGAFSSFDATLARETFQTSIISNSTVSDFKFEVGTETGNKIIQFNVTGAEGTVGFSRIAIPTGLMKLTNNSVTVLAGEKEVLPTPLPSQNAALNYLYFTYSHSNQTILIISSKTMDIYNQLLTEFLTLNATWSGLLNNYTSLSANYSQLQQNYSNLNASYNAHLLDYNQNLQNVRSLMYMFAAATAILIVISVYFSKQAHARPKKAPEEKARF